MLLAAFLLQIEQQCSIIVCICVPALEECKHVWVIIEASKSNCVHKCVFTVNSLIFFGASYSELSQRHEAHQVVPHSADILQQLLQLLRAHGCSFDAQLHTPGDAIHFHHT